MGRCNCRSALRRHLGRSGVTRAALHERTDTSLPVTFHDLRATGISWMAMRGDDPLDIPGRAGHANFATTEGYIRRGRNKADMGEPFPALPDNVVRLPTVPRTVPQTGTGAESACSVDELDGRPQRDAPSCEHLETA